MTAACIALGVLVAAGIIRRLTPLSVRPAPLLADGGGTEPVRSVTRHSSRRPTRAAMAGAAVLVTVIAGGPLLAVCLIALGFAMVRGRRIVDERVRRRTLLASLPDAIDAFTLLVGSGLTPRLAVAAMTHHGPAPTRPAFLAVEERMVRGEPFADALHVLTLQVGSGASALVELIRSSDHHGIPLNAALVGLGVETRAMRRRLDEAAARSLPVRLSFPLVVCTLPSFVLLAIAPAVLAALSSLGTDTW